MTRLRLSRARGFRLPDGAVSVARPGRWGNPFVVGRNGTAAECVDQFRALLAGHVAYRPHPSPADQAAYREHLAANWRTLAGKRLACWCRLDAPCHADVLAEAVRTLAAREAP